MAKLKLKGKVTIDQLLGADELVDMVNSFMEHRFEAKSAVIIWYDNNGVTHYENCGTASEILWAIENYKQVLLGPEDEE